MHSGMQFLFIKISTLPCILNCVGIPNLESTNLAIASIITLPYDGPHNGTKLSNLMK